MLLLEYTCSTRYTLCIIVYIPGTEYLGLSTADIHGRINVLWNGKIYSRFCLQNLTKFLATVKKLIEQMQTEHV